MGVIKRENFDLEKLKIQEFKRMSFKKAPFIYEGRAPVIEVDGQIKLYTNWFDGKIVLYWYSSR